MKQSMKKVADALQKIGQRHVPEDKHLVYVNDYELGMLEDHSGPGEPNPITGIRHYGDENGDAGNGTEGSTTTGEDGGGYGGGGDSTGYGDPQDQGQNASTASVTDAAFSDLSPAEAEYLDIFGQLPEQTLTPEQSIIANTPTNPQTGMPVNIGADPASIATTNPDQTAPGRSGENGWTDAGFSQAVEDIVSGRQGVLSNIQLASKLASLAGRAGVPGAAVVGTLGNLIGSGMKGLGYADVTEIANMLSGRYAGGTPGADSGWDNGDGGDSSQGMGDQIPRMQQPAISGGLMAPPSSQGPMMQPVWNDYTPMDQSAPPMAQQPAFSPAVLSALEASGMPADAIDYLMRQEKEKQIVEAMRKQAEKQPATASQIPRLEDYLPRSA